MSPRIPATGLILAVVACSTPPAALRADLLAYLQKTSSWASTEAETARALERILETEFVDEAEVRRQIADNGARIRRHLEDVDRYQPRTAEIRRIHATYRNGWRTLLGAYESITSGLDTGEQRLLADGRRALADWRDAIITVARELRTLSDQLQLEPGAVTAS